MLVFVYWIVFFLDRRSFFFHHLVLAAVRVDSRDEEAASVILDVVHVVPALLVAMSRVSFGILLLIAVLRDRLILAGARAPEVFLRGGPSLILVLLVLLLQGLEVVDVNLEVILLLLHLRRSRHGRLVLGVAARGILLARRLRGVVC